MKLHFIAIGGSVMHQLAIALSRKGHQVTGSDDEIFEPALGNLGRAGILPKNPGWYPEKIYENIDAIILGMHAKEDNPELKRARELGLPIYSFPEYIFQESRDKTRVVVGGSHGKTTTTAMIMHALRKSGREFDYMVGAKLQGFDQSVNITSASVIVCEGDEYPASTIERRPKFHFLFPHIAILTGIAWDHINVFPTFDIYLQQFSIFMDGIEDGGSLIYNASDNELNRLVSSHVFKKQVTLIPYEIPAHQIVNGETHVTIEGASGVLSVFGNHNLLNLNTAWLACKQLGMTAESFVAAMRDFSGASKRLEILAKNEHTIVYRDFAHAPSKVKATMNAVREQFPNRRLIAVLELHTFSSLNEKFMDQYHGSLEGAQQAAVFYSPHALELKRLPPLPEEKVKEGFGSSDLKVFTSREDLVRWLQQQNYADANVLLMSSGNYDGLDLNQLIPELGIK